jgi:hypothetical protein
METNTQSGKRPALYDIREFCVRLRDVGSRCQDHERVTMATNMAFRP